MLGNRKKIAKFLLLLAALPSSKAQAVLRIRDVYPGSRILIFTHPGSRIQKQQQKREVKKISFHTFLCSHKFHKIVNYFSFEVLKKIWANFQRIIELFTKKIVKKLLKIWSWDPGSEIRDPEKTYPGSRGQKGTGSRIHGSKRHRILDPDPQHAQDVAATQL